MTKIPLPLLPSLSLSLLRRPPATFARHPLGAVCRGGSDREKGRERERETGGGEGYGEGGEGWIFKIPISKDPQNPNLQKQTTSIQISSNPSFQTNQNQKNPPQILKIPLIPIPIPQLPISPKTLTLIPIPPPCPPGLIKSIATRSESVIETYRRDLDEFRSGLKKETEAIVDVTSHAIRDLPVSLDAGAAVSAAAQAKHESVGHVIDGFGGSVWRGTAEIITHDKDALADLDDESPKKETGPAEGSGEKVTATQLL